MKQDNPFAKLGALDQKLFEEAAPRVRKHRAEKANKPAIRPIQDKKSPSAAHTKPRLQEAGKQSNHDTMIPRYHDTMIPSNHDTMIPQDESSLLEAVRKSVKQIGKEAATHRFTLEEKSLLADIEYTYKRQGIRTSENEITRIAINYFIEDYRTNGEQSILAKILKRLNS
jgi:hypothetical protein